MKENAILKRTHKGCILCPRCKVGRLEPSFSNYLKRLIYPFGKYKCANCQDEYELIDISDINE